jgi:single-strand DNA-binding protein
MLNEVRLIGRLGRDPEVKYTQAGTEVGNFSVATSERWKSKKTGEYEERTDWHEIVAFGQPAKYAGEYLRKGDLVLISGSIRKEQWETRDGEKRSTHKIYAQRINGLGNKRDDKPKEQSTEPVATPDMIGGEDFDDDIPF